MTKRRPLPGVTDVARTLARLTKGEHFGKAVSMRIDEPSLPLGFTLGNSRGPIPQAAYRDGPEDRAAWGWLGSSNPSGVHTHLLRNAGAETERVRTRLGGIFDEQVAGSRGSGSFRVYPDSVTDIDLFEIVGHGAPRVIAAGGPAGLYLYGGCTTAVGSTTVTVVALSSGFADVEVGDLLYVDGIQDPLTVTNKVSDDEIEVDRNVGVLHAAFSGHWYVMGPALEPALAGSTTLTASRSNALYREGVPTNSANTNLLSTYSRWQTVLGGGIPLGVNAAWSAEQIYIKLLVDTLFLWIEGHDRLYILEANDDDEVLELSVTPAGGYMETTMEIPAGTGALQKDLLGTESFIVFRAGASTYDRIPGNQFAPWGVAGANEDYPWQLSYNAYDGFVPFGHLGLPAGGLSVCAHWHWHSLVRSADLPLFGVPSSLPNIALFSNWIVFEGIRVWTGGYLTSGGGSANVSVELGIIQGGALVPAEPMDGSMNPITAAGDDIGVNGTLKNAGAVRVINSGPYNLENTMGVEVKVSFDAGITRDSLGGGPGEKLAEGFDAVDIMYRRFRL